jgi:hypothetical protein
VPFLRVPRNWSRAAHQLLQAGIVDSVDVTAANHQPEVKEINPMPVPQPVVAKPAPVAVPQPARSSSSPLPTDVLESLKLLAQALRSSGDSVQSLTVPWGDGGLTVDYKVVAVSTGLVNL